MAKAPKESKKSSKAKPHFEVIKRVGTVIHYRIAGSEHGIDLTLDLKGHTYRTLRKGITFFFENDTVSVESLRYYPFRGASEVKSLLPLDSVQTPVRTTKATKLRGATPNVSILRKHF